MRKSIFEKCYGAKSITNKKHVGILSVRMGRKREEMIIGPDLTKNSTKREVAEKMRQLHAFYYIHGVYDNHEALPLFPKFEKEIMQFPFLCYIYSHYFMKKPWPDAEEIIAKNSEASLLYAIKVLKKRFQLGENSIKENPEACLAYCIKIMRRKALPKVMHQAMALHALKESSNAVKKYFSYKSVKNVK